MRPFSMLFTFLLLLAPLASVQGAPLVAGSYASNPQKFQVSYTLIHQLHEVEGVSHQGDARALITADQVQVQVRIPAKSFDSGNSNRDSNALSVIDASRYPYIQFKAVGRPCDMASGSCTMVLAGTIDFHGVPQNYQIKVEIKAQANGAYLATFKFPVSITAHKVERPSLLFMPVEDALSIVGSVLMERKS